MDNPAGDGAAAGAGRKRQDRSSQIEFGEKLKEWRISRRMTQQKLADALGYDLTYIAKLEGGTRPVSRQVRARLAQFVDAPLDSESQGSVDDIARPPLPSSPDALIGRTREVADVVTLLMSGARCVTLVGPPGIGKTRLAMEIAKQLDSEFANGAWWVSLLDVEQPGEVPRRVAHELGLSAPASADAVEGLVARLRSHRGLLVLDNFDRVVAAGTIVSALVTGAPNLAVLVTSRERLRLLSEHAYNVAPLPTADLAAQHSLDAVASAPAVELYVGRATMADAAFRLDASNSAAVARTSAHLDGIPLALVLAAGGVATEGVSGVERHAERHLGGLAPTIVDLSPHHRTLDTAIATSWRLLTSEEQRFLPRLSVFAGGFTAEAAAALYWEGPDTRSGGSRSASLVDSLVRKSLLETRPDASGGPRFELLNTIRSYAADRLRAAGLADDAKEHHLAYLVGLADTCGRGLFGAEQAQCLEVFAREAENLHAAFDWALTMAPGEALHLAVSAWRFFLARDIPTGYHWLEAALAANPAPSALRAEALAAAGTLAWVTGHLAESEADLDESLALARQLDLPSVAALAWLNKGALDERRDQPEDADRAFVEALGLYDSVGDERGRACALVGRGMICRRRGNLDAATAFWTTANGLFAAVGDRFSQTMALGNLAWAAEREGRLGEAEDWLADCRRMQVPLGDARGLAVTTAGLARLALMQGAFEDAARLGIEALVAFQRLGDRAWAASTLTALAAAAVGRGRWRPALRLVGAAEVLWDVMGAAQRDEDADLRQQVINECRHHLNAGETARAAGVGRGMTLDDAVEFARQYA